MRMYDFKFNLLILLVYVVLSPLLFGVIYPTTGDVSLIWIWVVVVTGLSSIASIVLITLLNFIVPPEKTYIVKGIIPQILSFFLARYIGEANVVETFIMGNAVLLLALYMFYGVRFSKKMQSLK